jgi:hypothetical protein
MYLSAGVGGVVPVPSLGGALFKTRLHSKLFLERWPRRVTA